MNKNNEILATVGNRKITQYDLDMVMKNLDPRTAAQYNSEDGKKQLVQELVNQELFYLDAKDNHLDEDAEYLKEVESMKDAILKKHAVNKLLNEISVSEEEVRNFYDENKALFYNQESVRASHILVSSETEAKSIYNEIKDGMPFEEAAKKYSICPSKSEGGDLGYFTRGRMVPEFEKVAFELEIGMVSNPVKSQFGYHLIKVTDKKSAEPKSYDESKNQIANMLLINKQQEVFYKKLEELKGKYEVRINI